jgi:hypothetical protein
MYASEHSGTKVNNDDWNNGQGGCYSPHLNIAETIWRKLKKGWLNPEDYFDKDSLFYAVNRCLANLGTILNIRYSKFTAN